MPRLRLIPSGRSRETTGEHFSSTRMRVMIDSLRGTHPNRYLVLDSPPVLNSPDARILSDLADLIVVVAGYGQVTADAIEKAASAFDPQRLVMLSAPALEDLYRQLDSPTATVLLADNRGGVLRAIGGGPGRS